MSVFNNAALSATIGESKCMKSTSGFLFFTVKNVSVLCSRKCEFAVG
jgi:hypothetical protein